MLASAGIAYQQSVAVAGMFYLKHLPNVDMHLVPGISEFRVPL